MTIARKPKASTPSKADVNKLIHKGGGVAGEKSGKPQFLQLRLQRTLVDRIDTVRETRTVPPPRHSWLLEAIHEKLEREEVPGERGLVRKKKKSG